jgi:hypothetical protein
LIVSRSGLQQLEKFPVNPQELKICPYSWNAKAPWAPPLSSRLNFAVYIWIFQTSLLRLQQRGWIASNWGTSENKRKAKYYSITKSGRKQLARETENWERIVGVIGRLLRLEGEE